MAKIKKLKKTTLLKKSRYGGVPIKQLLHHGVYCLQKGNYIEAEKCFQEVLHCEGTHADALSCLGIIRSRQEKYMEAEALFTRAIQNNPSNHSYYNNLGNTLKNQGKFEQAVDSYQKAVEILPEFFDPYMNMGNLFVLMREYDKAIDSYEKASRLRPQELKLLIQYGQTLDIKGYALKALEKFSDAMIVEPEYIPAFVHSAIILEKLNRYDEAYAVVKRIFGLDSNSTGGRFCLAKIKSREGNTEEALSLLESIVVDLPETQDEFSQTLFFELGQVHNQLGNVREAFGYFNHGNECFFSLHRKRVLYLRKENAFFTADPAPLKKWFTPERIAAWSKVQPNVKPFTPPIFMTGFSRSGTTLLDQILDSHPGTLTLEEKNTLQAINVGFCQKNQQLAFEQLKTEDFDDCRQKYWQSVDGFLETSRAEKVVIDRNPFATIRLGHIHRFFPEAKIIIAIRDPRDVVLSNFMQMFCINPATQNFLNLECTARYYSKVMEMLFLYREMLPLNIHYIHYENLVENLEGETRAVLDFLGLEWDDNVLHFQETAKKKHVRTASYHQVVKPIYKSASGRWKKYEEFLAPVLPIIQPYVDIFEKERERYRAQ